QEADEDRDSGDLPMVGVGDRARPSEFGLPRRVEQTPVRTDAAFVGFPRLVERLDDVVVDAARLGLGRKIAQDARLLGGSGVGIAAVVTGARPAALGNDDPLAREHAAQFVVAQHRLVDRVALRDLVPVGQDVRGDVINRTDELRMGLPGREDFACSNRYLNFVLYTLDQLDQVVDALLAAIGAVLFQLLDAVLV